MNSKTALQSPSNRRVHSKSIKRRQRILDAAARALAEHGYSEAKLSDIAQEAGTHAGSLYYYFPSREDLMKEVLLTSLNRMTEFSDSLESQKAQLTPLQRILAFVRLVIDQTLEPDDFYLRAYLRAGNQVPASLHEVLKTRRHRMRETLARLLSEAQAAGQILPHIDVAVAAQFVIGATSWVGTWYEPTGPYSVDKLAEAFVDLALHGLVGPHGTKIPAPAKTPGKVRKRRPAQSK